MKLLMVLYPNQVVQAVALGLLTSSAMLVLCHIGAAAMNQIAPGQVTEILRDFFGLEREGSAATWFSSLQLALIAVVCGLIFLGEKPGDSVKLNRRTWLGFALLFLFLSLDESAQVHERLDQIVASLSADAGAVAVLGRASVGPLLDQVRGTLYSYLLIYVPLLGGLGLMMARFFLRRSANRLDGLLFLVGLGCLAAKLGLDSLTPWTMSALDRYGRASAVIVEVSVMLLGEMLILHLTSLIFIKNISVMLLGEMLILTALLNHLVTLMTPSSWPVSLAHRMR